MVELVYYALALSLAGGALVKMADDLIDSKSTRKVSPPALVAALAYGVIAGYFLSFEVAFATVALKLSEYRKLDPSSWEEAVFFDHPSGRTRIWEAMRWKAEHLNDPDIMAGPISPQ